MYEFFKKNRVIISNLQTSPPLPRYQNHKKPPFCQTETDYYTRLTPVDKYAIQFKL